MIEKKKKHDFYLTNSWFHKTLAFLNCHVAFLTFASFLLLCGIVFFVAQSLAIFTVRTESSSVFNFIVSTLPLSMESSGLTENYEVTVSAKETVCTEVTIVNQNETDVDYAIYTTNTNVEIGYMKVSSLEIPKNHSQVVTVCVSNETEEEQAVPLSVQAGFPKKEIMLEDSYVRANDWNHEVYTISLSSTPSGTSCKFQNNEATYQGRINEDVEVSCYNSNRVNGLVQVPVSFALLDVEHEILAQNIEVENSIESREGMSGAESKLHIKIPRKDIVCETNWEERQYLIYREYNRSNNTWTMKNYTSIGGTWVQFAREWGGDAYPNGSPWYYNNRMFINTDSNEYQYNVMIGPTNAIDFTSYKGASLTFQTENTVDEYISLMVVTQKGKVWYENNGEIVLASKGVKAGEQWNTSTVDLDISTINRGAYLCILATGQGHRASIQTVYLVKK